jgi:hypothetical protein
VGRGDAALLPRRALLPDAAVTNSSYIWQAADSLQDSSRNSDVFN